MDDTIKAIKEEEKAEFEQFSSEDESIVDRQKHYMGWHCGNNNWGLGLITVGVILLAVNFFGFPFANWWALFILWPAIAKLGNYWWHGSSEDLTSGLVMGAVAIFFLFNLSWGRYWPAFLILFGITRLLSPRRGRRG